MPYVGNQPTTASFPFDQFSGNGTTTAFTLTYAPASTTSIIVSISGVVQNPNLYSVIGNTLTFSPAPPTGTNNIAVLYLGLPVIGTTSPGNTAFFSPSSFTATAGQTTFTPSGSYQNGFVNVIRNGSQLAPADYTATNGTTVTLNNPCVAGDIVVIEVFILSSLTNALPLTGGTVTGASQFNSTLSVNGAAVSGFTGFKNRIINPGMVIDQRNNGASVTPTDGQYLVDRWSARQTTASKFSAQQSTTAPAGFINSLLATSLSAYSVAATDIFALRQKVEGLNIADLAWGTSSASAVTLSFRVYSSLTGTFGGAVGNSSQSRSYPFSYSIPVANTWTTVAITIPGDTTGTWLTTNGVGIELSFGLGVGSTYSGTAGAWGGTTYYSTTGAVSVVGTSGATFYITGVQLERGSNATSFEFRDYGRELILCQRYFELTSPVGTTTSTNTGYGNIIFYVPKRATPTFVVRAGGIRWLRPGFTDITATGAISINAFSNNAIYFNQTVTGVAAGSVVIVNQDTLEVNAEL